MCTSFEDSLELGTSLRFSQAPQARFGRSVWTTSLLRAKQGYALPPSDSSDNLASGPSRWAVLSLSERLKLKTYASSAQTSDMHARRRDYHAARLRIRSSLAPSIGNALALIVYEHERPYLAQLNTAQQNSPTMSDIPSIMCRAYASNNTWIVHQPMRT